METKKKVYANVLPNGDVSVETQCPTMELELNEGESKRIIYIESSISQYKRITNECDREVKLDEALLTVRRYDNIPTLEEFKAVADECYDLAKNMVSSDTNNRFVVLDEKPFDPMFVKVITSLRVVDVTLKDGKIRTEQAISGTGKDMSFVTNWYLEK